MSAYGASNALQRIIYKAVSQALPDMRIFDDYVPETADLPYVRIGQDELQSDNGKLAGEEAYDATAEISVVCEEKGFQKAKSLAGKIVDIMDSVDSDELGYNVRYIKVSRQTFEVMPNLDSPEKAVVRLEFRVSKL